MSIAPVHSTLSMSGLADQVYRYLVRRGIDFAPLDQLANRLGATARELRVAVDSVSYLGFCTGGEPLVYCLPAQPMAAGFEVDHHAGRLVLRLPSHGLRPPLVISGQYVGPVPRHERPTTLGAGELAYVISRLTLLAGYWLPVIPSDPVRFLFELIAEGWRHASTSRLDGGFGIHRTSFTQLIACDPATNRLEFVTNRHRGAHQLVNLYPIPVRGVPA